MQLDSPRYTLLFAAAVCVVCALLVATSTVLLRERQQANKLLYLQKNVLQATGLVAPGERLPDAEIVRIFEENIRPRLVELETGRYVRHPQLDPERYDQRRARADPARSHPAPPNLARVKRVPDVGLVYLVMKGNRATQVVIPIEGLGLYGTLYGFIALDRDLRTVRGIAFYENRETPGLGGEVDNPRWRALWPGRKALDETGTPRLALVKGVAGPPDQAPYHVDALSGATVTSNGVTRMLEFWLGEHGFGPFIARLRAQGGP